MYYVGAINRVGIEPLGDNDFYGQSYFVDPEGQFVGEVGDAFKPELIVRDLDLGKVREVRDRWAFYRDRRPDAYDAIVAPDHRTREEVRHMARTLIKNGTVISPAGVEPADVLIDGETIASVGAPGFFADAEPGCEKVIDATGKHVVPGGIDVHTHMELPFGGTFASDTFETGTRAAAWGGVTTIVDFALQRTGEDVQAGLAEWHRKAEGECAIDYGFHQIIGGVDDAALKSMKYLTEHEGVTSFKLFMAYPGVLYSDDGQILRAMQTAAECGAMIMMHAENGIAIDVLVAQALARGDTDPVHHGYTRPSALEAEATHRAIVLADVAGNVPLYVVHMSAGEALEEVAARRRHGRNVFAETCPQYL